MAAEGTDKDFKLVRNHEIIEFSPGDDVNLLCQLSPATSAVAMEIRWFQKTDCLYLYKNGHVTVREGYEGRVSMDIGELQRGDVSLRLRKCRGTDEGAYTCQVIGGWSEEGRVGLWVKDRRLCRTFGWQFGVPAIRPEERREMEESVQSLSICLEENKQTFQHATAEQQLKAGHLEMMEKNRLQEEKEKQEMNDKLLEAKELQIKDGEQNLMKNMKLLEESNERLLKMERMLEDKQKDMEETKQQLEQKNKEVDQTKQQLQGMKKEMESTKQQLNEKNDQIEKTTKQLTERGKEAEKMTQQLEEKNKEIEKKAKQLEEKIIEMLKMAQELEEGNKLLQQRDTEFENMTEQLKKMTSELEINKRQLESREIELQNRNKEIEDLRTQLQEKERELEERIRQLGVEERYGDVQSPPLRRRRKRSIDRPPSMIEDSPGADSPESPDVSELRLVLIGDSEALKRAAINTMLGTAEFERQPITPTLTQRLPEIKHSKSRQEMVSGRCLRLVETPDWFCSRLPEGDMRQDVGLCVQLSAPGPHAFLLVIPVEPTEGLEKRVLEKMEGIFGEACWGNTLLLFIHAEGLRERSMEELLQTGSQELQQLVNKCGNRCHLLSVKDKADDANITRLLEKIEEMSRNKERFYSSHTYQEAERLREENILKAQLNNNVQQYLKKMEAETKQNEITKLHQKIQELERKMNEERDKEKKQELKKRLKRMQEERDGRKKEMKKRQREDMEEMRETYEDKARAAAERNLIKVILAEQQRRVQEELNRQREEITRKTEWKEKQIDSLQQNVQHLQATLVEEREKQRQGSFVQYALLCVSVCMIIYSLLWYRS